MAAKKFAPALFETAFTVGSEFFLANTSALLLFPIQIPKMFPGRFDSDGANRCLRERAKGDIDDYKTKHL